MQASAFRITEGILKNSIKEVARFRKASRTILFFSAFDFVSLKAKSTFLEATLRRLVNSQNIISPINRAIFVDQVMGRALTRAAVARSNRYSR